MTFFDSAFFGLVQGLTEFLPVSSSGHLTIFHGLLGGMEDNVFYDVVLHFATLLATVIYFRRKIGDLFTGFIADLSQKNIRGDAFLSGLYIAAAVVPTGIIGVVFKDPLERAFTSPRLAASMLIVTGTFLIFTRFAKKGRKTLANAGLAAAVLIGTVQGLAIIPGISRSGATISAALFLGFTRKDAGEFSFLISIPAIAGALILKAADIPSLASVDWPLVSAGFAVSFLSGLVALSALMGFVRRGSLWYFSIYCFTVSAAVLIFMRG
ncbi:MAG: undecaprenyl-diphosphate phosphatase [Fibrobacterota bacterium]